MALMKLINSGRLDRVAGVCKVGKEASVYLGVGWNHAAHAELSTDGWAGQRSKVWDDDDDDDGELESGSEEGSADTGNAEDEKVNLERAVGPTASCPLPSTELKGEGADSGAASGFNPETDVAIKIFKLSLAEFKDRRMYMDGDRRYAHTKLKHQNARKLVPIWAEKEFKNLIRVHRAGIPSPAPLLLRSHIIVMSFLGNEGWPAPQLREAPIKSAREWARVYRQVVAIMSAMYKWTHLVHADLSEYNLLYWQKQVYVLDLGQAVDTSHPMSRQFLENDVRNVTSFFVRKGVVVLTEQDLLGLITNTSLAPRPSCGYRTGAHDTHVPAVGSGARPLDLLVEQARLAALSAVESPLPAAADEIAVRSVDFDGDYFSGEDNPIAEAVDNLLSAAS
jgi:serine/threonine-protein kinase RIO1